MFNELLGTMMPESSWMTPEMGSLMATDPETAARHLASQGIPPPPVNGGELKNPYVAPNETYTGQVPYDPSAPAPQRPPNISEWLINNLRNSWNKANASELPAPPQMPEAGGEQPGTYNPLAAPALSTFPQTPVAPQVAGQVPSPALAPIGGPQAPGFSDPLLGAGPGAAQPSADANKLGGLAKMLSGVKAPPNPEVQKIISPRLPQQSAIPSGSPIAALLAKAVAGDPAAVLSLRAAIGGGR